MTPPKADDPRPYHHGDLRRALVEAAGRLLEAEGPSALSLRAVARAAGVSPAAPYHHFKDKAELLDAVAQDGWAMLAAVMAQAKAKAAPNLVLSALGVAYVGFAGAHPALYRVMYDTAREREAFPDDHTERHGEGAFHQVRASLIEAGADPAAEVDLELAATAAWCAAHGLAEMAGFRQFDHLKAALGGEAKFLTAVFRHMKLFPGPRTD